MLIDTDDAANPAGARLINITDGNVVPGSFLTSNALHTNPVDPLTRIRTGNIRGSFPSSGLKEYRAERGGPTGSGAAIHIHEAKIVVETN